MKIHGAIKDKLKELRVNNINSDIKGYIVQGNNYEVSPIIDISKKYVYVLQEGVSTKISSHEQIKGIFDTEYEAISFLKEVEEYYTKKYYELENVLNNIREQISEDN